MCGDMEDEAGPEEEVHARYAAHVHSVLAAMKTKAKGADPVHRHLDQLFRDLLTASVNDEKAPEEMTHYQRLAMEPLVFARLAGFIAAHLPLSEDPLRRIMEALMLGYSEGEIALAHDHDDDHDHFHGHGHGHSH